jgi:hypothetical protein
MEVQSFSTFALAELVSLTHLEIRNFLGDPFSIQTLPKLTHIIIYTHYNLANLKAKFRSGKMMELINVQLRGLPPSVTRFVWAFQMWAHAYSDEICSDEDFVAMSCMDNPYVFIGDFLSGTVVPRASNPCPNVFLDRVNKYWVDSWNNIRRKKPDIWSIVDEMVRRRQLE